MDVTIFLKILICGNCFRTHVCILGTRNRISVMWKKRVKNYLSYLIPLLSTEKGLWWMDLHFKSLDPWQLLQNPCLHPKNKKLDFSQFLGPQHNGGAPQQYNRNTITNTNTNKKTNVCMLRTRNRISVNFWGICTVEVHLHIVASLSLGEIASLRNIS